jgi:hypothetical protein
MDRPSAFRPDLKSAGVIVGEFPIFARYPIVLTFPRLEIGDSFGAIRPERFLAFGTFWVSAIVNRHV